MYIDAIMCETTKNGVFKEYPIEHEFHYIDEYVVWSEHIRGCALHSIFYDILGCVHDYNKFAPQEFEGIVGEDCIRAIRDFENNLLNNSIAKMKLFNDIVSGKVLSWEKEELKVELNYNDTKILTIIYVGLYEW